MTDEQYIRRAMELADRAADAGDVPIGAVLVSGDLVIEAKNEKETRPDATAHAELLLIQEASRRLGVWRLSDATLYVTKEPCVMCAGALVHARVHRVIFGCADERAGAAGSIINVLQMPTLNHHCDISSGVLQNECAAILQDFFKNKRKSAGAPQD